MKSLCLFSSYFTQNAIPAYVKAYLRELQKHFSEVILITNKKDLIANDLEYLSNSNINLMFVTNEGYDFGMWYKAMNQCNIGNYERLGLINDSCVLFKSLDSVFDKINKTDFDCCGMTDSSQISYHLQSYFLIINKKALKLTYDYFMKNGLRNNIHKVIEEYEVGMSTYLLNAGLKLGAIFSYKNYSESFNPSLFSMEKLIIDGIPLIKKKLLLCSFRNSELSNLVYNKLNLNPKNYVNLIKLYNNNEIFDINEITSMTIKWDVKLKIGWFKFYYFLWDKAKKNPFLKYLHTKVKNYR